MGCVVFRRFRIYLKLSQEDVPSSVELRWRSMSIRLRSRSECCSRVRHLSVAVGSDILSGDMPLEGGP